MSLTTRTPDKSLHDLGLNQEICSSQGHDVSPIHITDNFLRDNAFWIEGESIRAFMPTQMQTQITAMLVIPGVFFLLYGQVNTQALCVWLAASMGLSIYRWHITAYYVKNLCHTNTESQVHFLRQHIWTWPLTSFLWSTLVLIFFAQTTLFYEFAGFVIIASIGVFGATSYASHLNLAKIFINSMMVTLIAAMIWRFFVDTTQAKAAFFIPIFCLQLIFWHLLLRISTRLHQSHLQGLQLRRNNQNLIASLTEQTTRANQAVATKNRLLASAAHDIRQPVLALEMYATMLKSEPQHAQVLTDKVCLATKSVINMFDSLFDLARIESSQLNIKKSIVNLPELLRELDIQYQPAAQAKKIELRFHVQQLDIYTDHQLLNRILGNLIMNAIKFTDKGGVLVACRSTQKGVRFEIWDTGIGIPADQQEAVFNEFYKAQNHSGTNEGFGLGLSIVTRFCEPLDFKLSMRSRVGRGSVFCIEVTTTAKI